MEIDSIGLGSEVDWSGVGCNGLSRARLDWARLCSACAGFFWAGLGSYTVS